MFHLRKRFWRGGVIHREGEAAVLSITLKLGTSLGPSAT